MKTVRCRPSSRSIAAGEPRPPLAREQPRFGIERGRAAERRPRLVGAAGLVGRREPALAARARLAAIEAAVDENAREPDLERPRLAVRADVAEDLDERVLDGFVGVGGVAEILIGDAQRAPLMDRDTSSANRSRASSISPRSTSSRISTASRVSSRTAAAPPAGGSRPATARRGRSRHARRVGACRIGAVTHIGLRSRSARLFTVYPRRPSVIA